MKRLAWIFVFSCLKMPREEKTLGMPLPIVKSPPFGSGAADGSGTPCGSGCYLVKTPSAEVGRLKPRELVLKEGTAVRRLDIHA